MKSNGLHHVTAIAGSAVSNHRFYTRTLGLRLVKRTVNFDDPGTYHLYFGGPHGQPGTILTFFPWEEARGGRRGVGEVAEVTLALPPGSLRAWRDRLEDRAVSPFDKVQRFGAEGFRFSDGDGMALVLVEDGEAPADAAWTGEGMAPELAIRGIQGVTQIVREVSPTAELLKERLGFVEVGVDGNRHRFAAGHAGQPGRYVDLVVSGEMVEARLGKGSVHHVAFRAADDDEQARVQQSLSDDGFSVSEVRDRQYFRSIYFREPGGVLYEVATDGPGFALDEPTEALGSSLKLPPQYEGMRARLEASLPPLDRTPS